MPNSRDLATRTVRHDRGQTVGGARRVPLAPLWHILAASGFGLWAWLGAALFLGMYATGRSILVPLGLGALLAGVGLLVACLPWRGAADWYGWWPRRDSYPTRTAMMALGTFLPGLAVAALARDGNGFWVTRLAGVALTLGSLASLTSNGFRFRRQLSSSLQRAATSLPVSRLVFAGYAGGLWMWLCALAQGEPAIPARLYPWWILLLLMQALLLGLIEGQGWQALVAARHRGNVARAYELQPTRLVAASLTYGVPCVALMLGGSFSFGLVVAAVAVPSCLLGKWLERHMYESALAGHAAG